MQISYFSQINHQIEGKARALGMIYPGENKVIEMEGDE